MSNVVKSWWWRHPEFTNFGDELGHMVLEKLGYEVEWSPLDEAEIITVGTVLDLVKQECKPGTIIWGTGAAWDKTILKDLDVRAVRGRLTAKALQVDVPLGDPGLLVSKFWPKSEVRYKVGVVPHYVDERNYSWADIVIDVKDDPGEVIKQISACKIICASSLHGLVVAQSYGIPAVRINHNSIISGDFKWMDYITALDRPIEIIQEDLIKCLNLS